MSGKNLMYTIPNQNFFKISLSDICSNGKCSALCNPGTFNTSDHCEMCSKGFYSKNFGSSECTPCPIGTFNNHPGGSIDYQCYPCPYGYYNSREGSFYCLECGSEYICQPGSSEPQNIVYTNQILSIQPSLYATTDTNNVNSYYQLSIIILLIIVVAVIVF